VHLSSSCHQSYGVGLLALLIHVTACTERPTAGETQPAGAERGRYLVNIGGCNDCHSPKIFTATGPVPDTTRLLSGQPAGEPVPAVPRGVIGPTGWGALASNHFTAWAGPWGVSFAANLTPHETGLLPWTPELFIQTMRTGRHFGSGRPILPPMPWYEFAKMSDEDLRAVFAYLRSLRPINNQVPAPIPPGAQPASR
jgi:cytochrome c553